MIETKPFCTMDTWEIHGRGLSLTAGPTWDIYSLLIQEGHIPHPYQDTQEEDVQWVARQNWQARSVFSLRAEDLPRPEERWFLEFPEIDTITAIRLNGQHLGVTDNQFHPHEFRVDEILQEGNNTLEIDFSSPEQAAFDLQTQGPYAFPHAVFPLQSPHRNMIRKTQCHSGWDWGPCLMTSGIYQAVRLIRAQSSRVTDISAEVIPPAEAGEEWQIRIDAAWQSWQASDSAVEVQVLLYGPESPTPEVSRAWTLGIPGTQAASRGGASTHITVKDPELWWPNGMGEQNLYTLELRWPQGYRNLRLGFRTLEVVRQKDEFGTSFYFQVNGQAFFAKGSNWIPADALPSFEDPRRVQNLLTSARDSHQNMIRVWGGGHYESEAFFDACDRLGLLVWQDFMFACSTYPATPDFFAQVEREVEFQVLRLRHRPSVALWCGNNENLGALTWFDESLANRDRYLVDYDRLYEGVIGDTVRRLDSQRLYWPSSPSGGSGDYSDGWHDDANGDMHYWSVWHEGKPFEGYFDVIPRFCSEFGFQSFPSPEGISRAMTSQSSTYSTSAEEGQDSASTPSGFLPQPGTPRPRRTWADPQDWCLTSPTLDYHQKNPRGNTIILDTMLRYFRMPSRLADTLYISQVQQMRAFETAVEYWRSQAPRSMGALYWQLNDLWPVASWSSIEYPDKWKLTHYGVARFFEPLHLAGIIVLPPWKVGTVPQRSAPVRLVLEKDLPQTMELHLRVRLISFGGSVRDLVDETRNFDHTMAQEVGTYDPGELDIDPRDWFLHFELSLPPSGYAGEGDPRILGVSLGDLPGGTVISRGFRFFTAPKHARIQDPGLRILYPGVDSESPDDDDSQDSPAEEGPWLLTDVLAAREQALETARPLQAQVLVERPAFYVSLDSPGWMGRWSSNAEVVLPGEQWNPVFIPRNSHTRQWTSALVTSWDRQGLESSSADSEEVYCQTEVYDLWSSGVALESPKK
ncbi:glycoside hydrolase family 2 protein [Spirochaeta lutea]|uniref:glycoside hydrolase family 2 protein n=1 Tax=Spirochaeta lutea TaxID=1480694 RepID=UPI0009E0958D|nr:glycoside hydrolase family 2 protein [Spirochaeta lutea]